MVVLSRDRYLVFQIYGENTEIELSSLKKEVWDKYKTLFGITGTTDAGLFFEIYEKGRNSGLIRCTNKSISHLLSVLAMITELDGKAVLIVPLLVSGTIKKAKNLIAKLSLI